MITQELSSIAHGLWHFGLHPTQVGRLTPNVEDIFPGRCPSVVGNPMSVLVQYSLCFDLGVGFGETRQRVGNY